MGYMVALLELHCIGRQITKVIIMKNEVRDILTLAMEMTAFSILCIILAYFAIYARNIYSYKEYQEGLQEIIEIQGERYFFDYGEHIYGSDVVEFIKKNDLIYDYYLYFKDGSTFEITKEYSKELREKNIDSTYLWTNDYLTNQVFNDRIYNEYDIKMILLDDNNYAFYIYEK